MRVQLALRRKPLGVALGVTVFTVGCFGGPAAVGVPHVDPADASETAVATYDKNGDGRLSKEELAACPGILRHLAAYDTSGDGAIDAAEIESEVRRLRTGGVGLTKLSITVRYNGRSLEGATVKIVPEAYLGNEVLPATGVTNGRGIAVMDLPDDQSPASDRGLLGVHYGTYKVEVTHPTVAIPAKYNTATTLGYETEVGNPSLLLDLRNR